MKWSKQNKVLLIIAMLFLYVFTINFLLPNLEINRLLNPETTIRVTEGQKINLSPSRISLIDLTAFGVIVASLIVILILLKKPREKLGVKTINNNMLMLRDYIKKALENGVDEEVIRNKLLSVGWEEHYIDKAFSQIR